MSDSAIKAENLQRKFGGTDAVDGIDLDVADGEIYGFLGPNGAGKSTTVRMLCTLLNPTGGSASVAGFDIVRNAEDVRLRIGAALQEAALDPRQTGRELLRLQARLYGLRGADVNSRVDALIEIVGIGDAIDRMIGTYSGGMRRRLDLAAALVHNPEVLFLDEPTTGLDPVSRATVWAEVRRLNRELGVTIFLTTQYLNEADELARRIGIIDRGKIVAEGSPEELKRQVGGGEAIVARVEGETEKAIDAARRVDLVEDITAVDDVISMHTKYGAQAIGPIAVVLDDCGVDVISLTLRTPTLDDVFMELTGGHLETAKEESAE